MEITNMHKDFSKILLLSAEVYLVIRRILLSIDLLHILIILLTVRPFPLNNSFLKIVSIKLTDDPSVYIHKTYCDCRK